MLILAIFCLFSTCDCPAPSIVAVLLHQKQLSDDIAMWKSKEGQNIFRHRLFSGPSTFDSIPIGSMWRYRRPCCIDPVENGLLCKRGSVTVDQAMTQTYYNDIVIGTDLIMLLKTDTGQSS